jgi:para-aminobenzoate synthetase component 1
MVQMLVSAKQVFKLMNAWGSQNQPFVFGIDFHVKKGFIFTPEDALNKGIRFNINGFTNSGETIKKPTNLDVFLTKKPVSRAIYQKAFDWVMQNIIDGNSYLTNLTLPTPIELNLTLNQIYSYSKAKYSLLFGDKFVVFSPETFIKITGGQIFSFPMKGTIDASIPYARKAILNNTKEKAEHQTIVDLIRNDLGLVADTIKVNRFRYITKIKTHAGNLLQVSSEIEGNLPLNYHSQLGTIMNQLLPAGSVTGAPKRETVRIIREAEKYDRGFYTGVFGYFDGNEMDSAVMIRFIRQTRRGYEFLSGGGITINSNADAEYNELISKVYVPFI